MNRAQKEISVIHVGIGGYGARYVVELLAIGATKGVKLIACVEPFPEKCVVAEKLRIAGIPLYQNLADALAHHSPDLVVLATPIHKHAADAILALRHGAHVLCEKPAAGNLADALRMAEAARSSGQFLAIGFQWSYSRAVERLKTAILAGKWGRPLHLRTKVFWPRPQSYYLRNAWAGKIAAPDGDIINDSPVNNATAHYLHNMLYLMGDSLHRSAEVRQVTARRYRAYTIENYDSAVVNIKTVNGVDIDFYTTHTIADCAGPVSVFEFEHGVVHYDEESGVFLGESGSGEIENFGSPDAEGPLDKFWQCVEAVRFGLKPACDIANALAHVQVVEAIQAGPHDVSVVDPSRLQRLALPDDDYQLVVQGQAEAFDHAFESNLRPAG